MTTQPRKFESRPAVRERVPLLIGLTGPSGSGKTFSALRLAKGIQAATGGKIVGIDTESRRMLHYADTFQFEYMPFAAPFGSLDYLAALQVAAAIAQGGPVIVDSTSHEHEGPGGMIDFQGAEVERLTKGDTGKADRVKMLAWVKPKQARRQLINGILQLGGNFIFCFRAKSISKPVKSGGKTEVVQQGFVAVSGDEFIYEMTLNALLLPKSGGVPTWQSEYPGEAAAMKLPEQFRGIFAQPKPLDEDTGRKLAEWAGGGKAPADESVGIKDRLEAAARKGTAALKELWGSLKKPQQLPHVADMPRLKQLAATYDQMGQDEPPLPFEGEKEREPGSEG